MPTTLMPDIERLAQEHVDGKEFQSADDVLRAALRLFQRYQIHQRLRTEVKAGFDQIRRGEAVELEDDLALRAFFDDIKIRGHQRLSTGRTP